MIHKLPALSEPSDFKTSTCQGALPDRITTPVEGLDGSGILFINILLNVFRCGQQLFRTSSPSSEDWAILLTVIANDAKGRATVTKNVVEITGRAYGTIRAALVRFEQFGFIEVQQRIGRSELYTPTAEFKDLINQTAAEFDFSILDDDGEPYDPH